MPELPEDIQDLLDRIPQTPKRLVHQDISAAQAEPEEFHRSRSSGEVLTPLALPSVVSVDDDDSDVILGQVHKLYQDYRTAVEQVRQGSRTKLEKAIQIGLRLIVLKERRGQKDWQKWANAKVVMKPSTRRLCMYFGANEDKLRPRMAADPNYSMRKAREFLAREESKEHRGSLAKRFLVSPFSVLDGRSGEWIKRKQAWISLGLRGEEGREDTCCYQCGGGGDLHAQYKGKSVTSGTGTSMFDPALMEVMLRWFCRPGGKVLDPFAGGTTLGIVSEKLGYRYTGVELREDQIEANRKQAEKIGVDPTWIQGTSTEIDCLLPAGEKYDFVLTSPPYYDLEQYRGGDKDGSGFGTYEEFLEWYDKIFALVVNRVKLNSFVVLVVGEIRDKKTGLYRGFVPDTWNMLKGVGLHPYNRAVYLTPIGSLPIRAGKQFSASRKLGNAHQDVLIFWKGKRKDIWIHMSPTGDVMTSDDVITSLPRSP